MVSRPTEVVAVPEGSLVGRGPHQMVDWPHVVVEPVLEVLDVANCTLVDKSLLPVVACPMEVVDQL